MPLCFSKSKVFELYVTKSPSISTQPQPSKLVLIGGSICRKYVNQSSTVGNKSEGSFRFRQEGSTTRCLALFLCHLVTVGHTGASSLIYSKHPAIQQHLNYPNPLPFLFSLPLHWLILSPEILNNLGAGGDRPSVFNDLSASTSNNHHGFAWRVCRECGATCSMWAVQ